MLRRFAPEQWLFVKELRQIIFDGCHDSVPARYIFINPVSKEKVDSCQTVFIIGIGANAFGADDVTCPDANVNVIGCNFPDLNSIPGIILKDTARPCAQVSVNLILDTFSNLGTPCLRIRRTWTITDALQPGFVVNCVQNINIIDTVKPVLSGVRDTTVYAGVTCNATVDLPKLVATDCDPNVVITNSLNAQGADIGPVVFPRGMTTIKYKAVDKCGNKDSLYIKVTVIDTAGFKIICQNDTIVACGATFTPRAAGNGSPPCAPIKSTRPTAQSMSPSIPPRSRCRHSSTTSSKTI